MRSPWRWATALGLLAAMVAGAVVLTRETPAGGAASTTVGAAAVTTTSTAETTTTTAATTSTTTAEQRLEEVRAIVQDLWYRWFDAIYRKDETVLWSIVANSERYNSALEAMEASEFSAAPTQAGVVIGDVEILLDRSDCLVVYSSLDVTAFKGAGAVSSGVDVLWADERYGWRRASLWKYRGDLWANDCNLMERETTP
jgi:hypothetical protein